MENQPRSIEELAAQIDPQTAQRFTARVMAILGSESDCGADQIGSITAALHDTQIGEGRPRWFDHEEEDIDYWRSL